MRLFVLLRLLYSEDARSEKGLFSLVLIECVKPWGQQDRFLRARPLWDDPIKVAEPERVWIGRIKWTSGGRGAVAMHHPLPREIRACQTLRIRFGHQWQEYPVTCDLSAPISDAGALVGIGRRGNHRLTYAEVAAITRRAAWPTTSREWGEPIQLAACWCC